MFLTPLRHTNYTLADAFNEMERMEKAFFGNGNASFATDIIDLGDAYRLDIELPGFKKEEITVSLEGKYLTVKAKHIEDANSDDKTAPRYLSRERNTGEIFRSFTVNGIDTEAIDVLHENGLLSITLPKKKPIEPEVKTFTVR